MVCTARFFFFKQKTAYEMRISDWSSDVCSSDLHQQPVAHGLEDPATMAGDERVEMLAPVGLDGGQRRHLVALDEGAEADRSEERRVGKEGVSSCRSRLSP